MSVTVSVEEHPLLEAGAFVATLPEALGALSSSPELLAALSADIPHVRDDETKAAVRRLLRHGGYRPAGRGKPASEYLVQAADRGALGSINPVVDACNAASLWGGLPISVVDLDRAAAPYRIGIPAEGASYVFNTSGQEITVSGLLCLHDAEGPSANAVKDSQRTKTSEGTRKVLAIVWGTQELEGRTEEVVARFRRWLDALGATTALGELQAV